MKLELNKKTGKYEVQAFGIIHEFDDKYEASCYCDEVIAWFFQEEL